MPPASEFCSWCERHEIELDGACLACWQELRGVTREDAHEEEEA